MTLCLLCPKRATGQMLDQPFCDKECQKKFWSSLSAPVRKCLQFIGDMAKDDSNLFGKLAAEFPAEANEILDESVISDDKIDKMLLERFQLTQEGTTRDKLYVLYQSLKNLPIQNLSFPDYPDLLAFYDLKKKLGSGTYGTVYKAKELSSGKNYALKLMTTSSTSGKKEAQILQWFLTEYGKAKFHPHIVPYYGAFVSMWQGRPFFVIKTGYISGKPLSQFKGKQIPLQLLKSMAVQLLDGLTFLHKNGLAHRDIKLENVMYTKYGHLTIIDLGSSCFVDGRGPTPPCSGKRTFGTLLYLSPELIQLSAFPKETTPDTFLLGDVYSAGVVLFTLINRDTPWWFIINELPSPYSNDAFFDLFTSNPYEWIAKNFKSLENLVGIRYHNLINIVRPMMLPQNQRATAQLTFERLSK